LPKTGPESRTPAAIAAAQATNYPPPHTEGTATGLRAALPKWCAVLLICAAAASANDDRPQTAVDRTQQTNHDTAPVDRGGSVTVPWRAAWCTTADAAKLVPAAGALRFNAIVAHGSMDRMRVLARRCRDADIECYYWVSLAARSPAQRVLTQVMRPPDMERLEELAQTPDLAAIEYQFGGEPPPGKEDVLAQPLMCFHQPQTAELIRKNIRDALTDCPDLTGIALDSFGYRNYRGCRCDVSETMFAEYRRAHPDLPEEDCRNRFSLETLVLFINRTADTVRELRPNAKTAIHVFPAFLPDPLYGRRLNVDYCCETVAWFTKPYWPDRKIVEYTRAVAAKEKRTDSHSRGIPLVGLVVDTPAADKSPERFAHELTLVFQNCPSRSIAVYPFEQMIQHDEHRDAFEYVLENVWPE
jgi:hypothetical protein